MPDSFAEALPQVVLKPSRQFPFLSRHPWVHARSLAEAQTEHPLGTPVDLVQHDGTWIARGLFNPHGGLRVRLYSWNRDQPLDDAFFHRRIDEAIQRRRLAGYLPADAQGLGDVDTAARLVFSEADGLSGLIVDQYAGMLVVQFAAGVIAVRREAIIDHLQATLKPRAIYVRIDTRTAKLEGIEPYDGFVADDLASDQVGYRQNGIEWTVDLRRGQKTGGYLDQRDNHAAAARFLTGRRVLDVCCYTGGFGLVAAAAGATAVLGIDSSQAALDAAAANAQRNGLEQITFQKADCFDFLKALPPGRFDGIVLDPPRFAGSRKQVSAALRAYGRLNRSAIEALPAGGILVTNSCSGSVRREDFLNLLADVGRRTQRDITILEARGAAADHPLRVSCPESDYLKSFICEVQ